MILEEIWVPARCFARFMVPPPFVWILGWQRFQSGLCVPSTTLWGCEILPHMTFGLSFCPLEESAHLLLPFFHDLLYLLHVSFFCHFHAVSVNMDFNCCNAIWRVSPPISFGRVVPMVTILMKASVLPVLKNGIKKYQRFSFHHSIELYREYRFSWQPYLLELKHKGIHIKAALLSVHFATHQCLPQCRAVASCLPSSQSPHHWICTSHQYEHPSHGRCSGLSRHWCPDGSAPHSVHTHTSGLEKQSVQTHNHTNIFKSYQQEMSADASR